MTSAFELRSTRARLFARTAILTSLGFSVLVAMPLGSALAQPLPPADVAPPPPDAGLPPGAASTEDFREALADFGGWAPHRRWGEVWIPANVQQDWRPYTRGHWVYTDEWGWYWVSDDPWGWITDHYGRWVFDGGLGWAWVPGEEWSPAWVQWRQGAQHVGWAPLPPDDVVDDYEDDPNVWMFVRAADLTAPQVYTVFVPVDDRPLYIRDTFIVNRTVLLRQRGLRIAVNPGIAPAFIAAALRRPIRAVALRPPVLPRTFGVRGSVTVRGDDWRRFRAGGPGAGPGGRPGVAGARVRVDPTRITVRETTTTFRPGTNIAPPMRLERGQPGRFGDRPPRAVSATPGGPGGPGGPSGLRPGMQPAGPGQVRQGVGPGQPGSIRTAPRVGPAGAPLGGSQGATSSGVRTGVQPAGPGGGVAPGARQRPAGAPVRVEDRRPPPSTTGPVGTPPTGVQRAAPPPTGVQRTAPPPPAVQRTAPRPAPAVQRTAPPPAPAVQRVAPPPAAVQRPASPPPAAVQRTAPPPPAAVQRQAPPPTAVQRAAPPPQQQRPQPRRPGEPEPPR